MKNKPSDHLLEVAQEITFAKALASNDKTIRARALKKLKKWLVTKSKSSKGFTEDGLIRLWRGLFYNVWMSDKPLVQEEVVENISNLVHCFDEFSDALSFIKCFFQTLSESWFNLDAHRFDKYLMFVRRFLRQCFKVTENYGWKQNQVIELIEVFKNAFLKAPLGLMMHICEIYLEELAKVSGGNLDADLLFEFIKPFGDIMATSTDARLIKHIVDFIYMYLLKQSDVGIKHELKFEAWRKMGCPKGNINVLEEVDMHSDDEESDEADYTNNAGLDARAGHVDVLLPTLKFDANTIINHLTELKRHKSTTIRSRKRLTDIITKFKIYEHGKYPLGIHKVAKIKYEDEDELIENAAMELMEEEMEIYAKEKLLKENKYKKRGKTIKGDWLITSEKQNNLLSEEECSSGNTSFHNTWEVSSESISSNLNDNHKKKKRKKHKKNKTNSSTVDITSNGKIDIPLKDESSDWGSVSWDDDRENEIIIQPKKKLKLSNSFKVTPISDKTSKGNVEKNTSFGTPGSGKKVEFVLNRNSFQDEKNYRRSLKKNPIIKFNGDLQPPPGVLKSTPFSSPVNPFVI